MPKARERGELERGNLSPLSLGDLGGLPLDFFLNFERFYVRF